MIKSALATLAAAAALAAAPVAHADNFYPSGQKGDRNLTAVRLDVESIDRNYGAAMPDDMPNLICAALRAGEGETATIASAEHAGIPHRVSQVVTYSSEWHFCPDYY